ncbi:HAMP domain-containing sensor histidine kinase [Peptostreptococcaceae bacterium AGR-M142]
MKKKDKIEKILYYLFYFVILIFKFFNLIFKYLKRGIKKLVRAFKFSLSFKITSVYITTFILIMLMFSITILGSFKFLLVRKDYSDIKVYSQKIKKLDFLDRSKTFDLDDFSLKLDIYDSFNKKIYTNQKGNSYKKESKTLFKENRRGFYYDFKNSNIAYTEYIFINNDVYTLFLVKDVQNHDKYLMIIAFMLLILFIMGFIITIITGKRVNETLLYPIKDMTKKAKAISFEGKVKRLKVNDYQDELKALAITFNEMLQRLENSYEQKDRFVSDASHELRTPISVIQGYINMLNRWGKKDEKILEESIDAIKKETLSMKDLVEKLLFLARADKKTQTLDKKIFSLTELMDEIYKESCMIDDKHIFVKNFSSNVNFFGDVKLLKQAIRIFIDNSIKFTKDDKKICLNLYEDELRIFIEIEDQGMGIDKKDLRKIFDRFYRTDESRTKSTGGTGLGLSIAKWIINSHNGKIEVKSEVDVGTKFKIIIHKN